MSTSISAMEGNFVRVGTVYVPEPLLALFLRLLQPRVSSSTAPMPSTVAGDKTVIGISEPSTTARPSSTPASQDRAFFSLPSVEPATGAPPSVTPGDAGGEGHDAEGGNVAAAAGREAPPAAPRAEDGGSLLPARRSGAHGLRRGAHQRGRRPAPCPPEPISARTLDTVIRSAGMDDPATSSECCATCGTPGVRTEG
jgi:hypothetical protein